MQLRPYQTDAIDALESTLDRLSAALLVMPTGTGKTVVLAHLVDRWLRAAHGRVLMLAHRDILIQQLATTTAKVCSLEHGFGVGVEMGPEAAHRGCEVVVASVPTLRGKRLEQWKPDHFSLVITDEAHHAAAPTYGAIFEHFSGARSLGCTATPERLDGKSLAEIFGDLAFVYELRDAVEDGWIVPISAVVKRVASIDLDGVRVVAGDFRRTDLSEEMTLSANLNGVVKGTLEEAQDRPTIVFAVDVMHAHLLAKMFAQYGKTATAVDGSASSSDRERALSDFSNGRTQFLVNCQLYTEGIDLPTAACVAMARPTMSRCLYMQMMGRGTRLLGQSLAESERNGKSDLLVIDFVGNVDNHRLRSAFDIWDEAETGADVRARALQIAEGEPTRIDAALRRAEIEAAQARRADAVKTHTLKRLSPAELLGVSLRRGRWGGRGMTEAQFRVLERAKLAKSIDEFDRGEASQLIDEISGRRRRGLCTYPQMRVLQRAGLRTDASFELASQLITALVDNRWQAPAELLELHGAHLMLDDDTEDIRRAALEASGIH